jgi:hypothetical protein
VTADRSARTGVTLRLRPPAVLRVYVVAFLLVWFGMLAVTTVNAGTSALPVVLAFVGVGGVLGYRLIRLGVDATPDRLVIRNNVRNRIVPRAQVTGFDRGAPTNLPFGGLCVYALTSTSGVIGLGVTTAPTFIPGWCRRVDRDLTSLRKWLDAGEPEGGPW